MNSRNEKNIRTENAKKNIFASIIIKGISIITSFLLVPVTIDYLNPTRYGIWLTLSSMLTWIAFFDLGFTHGFRNKFAEAVAKRDTALAKCFVSTAYISLLIVFSIILLVSTLINQYIDWSKLLNVEIALNKEIKSVIDILLLFFCIQMVLKVVSTMIIADQKPAISSAIDTSGQVLALLAIFTLTKTTQGNLEDLAYAMSICPTLILIIATIYFFKTKYNQYKPSISFFRYDAIREILGLGSKFFIIQLSSIFVFQCINILISNTEGPDEVTVFNVIYKYFNTFNMLMTIILTPFWSAFTNAYHQNDFEWMRKTYKSLTQLWFLIAFGILIALVSYPFIIRLWLNDKVIIPPLVAVLIAFYIMVTTCAGISVSLLNGLGKIQIQMYIQLLFSIFTIPILYYLLKHFGLTGSIPFLILNPLLNLIFSRIQLNKILNNKAIGIWNR